MYGPPNSVLQLTRPSLTLGSRSCNAKDVSQVGMPGSIPLVLVHLGMDADRLLREALLLPAEARAKLASELICSLEDSTVDEDRDVEWALEIRRRINDYDAGLVRARPAEEVLAELKATASARRP